MNFDDLRGEIGAADAKAAFDVLIEWFSAAGEYRLAAHEQGFLNSLRIFRGDEFCFAAIPNDEWVLAYIRKPELRRGKIKPEAVITAFPDARMTNKGEVTLRVKDARTALRWLKFIEESLD